LESNFYHERNSLRINILKDIFKDKNIPYENIVIEGESKLQQLLNAIMLADLTSYFLALLNEVDPTPVPTIDFMKSKK
jgi:glucose/mannose-6-phosphate isomerase